MKYHFHSGDFLENYYRNNNISVDDLDASFFDIKKEEALLTFKKTFETLKSEKFLIVGDYDCDGICATAIIKRLLTHLNIEHLFYIPSRSKEGYGLNDDIVKMAKKNNITVIFTVDNGASAYEPIELATSLDIKVMVLDHHEYAKQVECFGFIHPNLLSKPFQKLSAGGLATLFSSLFYEDELSIVYGGLSIIGDAVGVLGYNRLLIKKMYEILNTGRIYQMNLLNESSKFDAHSINYFCIPKINAVSRLDYNSNLLVKYLLGDYAYCLKEINTITKINNERKNISSKLSKDILNNYDKSKKINIIVGEDYLEGICGLIANRIMYSTGKPTIVFNKKDGILKGSGRSPEGFNIYEYLKAKEDLFLTFGGHENACGLSLNEEKFAYLCAYIDDCDIEIKEVYEDVYLIDINDVNFDLLSKIKKLEPFGVDLKEPLLAIKDFEYQNKTLVSNRFSKYFINDQLSAISFKNGDLNKEFEGFIGHIEEDTYRKNALVFTIEDFI